jgi:membrane protein implicated in regulation of membrane protease activity
MLAIVSVLFVFFIWPTIYRYDHTSVYGNRSVVRINRITGNAERLSLNGWVQMKTSDSTSNEAQEPKYVPMSTAAPSAPIER